MHEPTPIEPRKVAVFTGNRSDYGLLFPLIKAIEADLRLTCHLLVSGGHLQDNFGRTLQEIESDGFDIYAEVRIETDDDSPFGTAQAIGTGILSVGRILAELKPDFLLIYGDRYETFAAAIAGSQLSIPVAHVEGGDYTEGGALDDSVRHAITKLSHLHFATNTQAVQRLTGLGEEPWRINNVGLPVLDLVSAGVYASPEEVAKRLDLDLSLPIVLFCQHSVATEFDQAGKQTVPSLTALETLAGQHYQVIITHPNSDAGGRRILKELHDLEQRQIPGITFRPSLGRYLFHGVLNVIGQVGRGACVGNSSGGIKETPAFGCPSVNIGSRQRGRLRGTNVIDVPYEADATVAAIQRCVEDQEWRSHCRHCVNPYGRGDSGARVAEILAATAVEISLLQKKMTY